jgi:hypothetical protein
MEQEGVHAVIGALINIIAHGLRAQVRLVFCKSSNNFSDTNHECHHSKNNNGITQKHQWHHSKMIARMALNPHLCLSARMTFHTELEKPRYALRV